MAGLTGKSSAQSLNTRQLQAPVPLRSVQGFAQTPHGNGKQGESLEQRLGQKSFFPPPSFFFSSAFQQELVKCMARYFYAQPAFHHHCASDLTGSKNKINKHTTLIMFKFMSMKKSGPASFLFAFDLSDHRALKPPAIRLFNYSLLRLISSYKQDEYRNITVQPRHGRTLCTTRTVHSSIHA